MNQIRGSQSISFGEAPYLISSACVAGSKEAEGPLGKLFDMVNQDDLFWSKNMGGGREYHAERSMCTGTWKSTYGCKACALSVWRRLLRQGIATSMGVEELQIPMFGLYGACSTSGEALALSAMSVAAGYGEYMLAVTSSTLEARKRNFGFRWGMHPSVRYLPAGR